MNAVAPRVKAKVIMEYISVLTVSHVKGARLLKSSLGCECKSEDNPALRACSQW